jgi:hypothetical protein
MDAQLFTIVPFDLNGKLLEKRTDRVHSQQKRKNYNAAGETSKKPPVPTKYEQISKILSAVFHFELIWLCGLAISASVLCLAIRIDRRYYR